MKKLIVNAPSWIRDVSVGQTRKFAIEVSSNNAMMVSNRCLCLIHNEANSYKGCSQVWKSTDKKNMFFDFGSIIAVKKSWKQGVGFYNGTWNFSIDGYYKGIEEINYEWIISGIELSTSPLIIGSEDEIIIDSSRPSSVMLEKMNVLEDLKRIKIIGDVLLPDEYYLTPYLKYRFHLTRKT